jgi:hypothetical protein
MRNIQRVRIKIDDVHELSIINYEIHTEDSRVLDRAEVAICHDEGVANDTVTGISDVKALLAYLQHYFGEKDEQLEVRKNGKIPF